MSYFQEVCEKFGTELWINNPAIPEMSMALAAGAVGLADNPAWIKYQLKTEPEYVHAAIDEVLAEAGGGGQDLQQLAMLVVQKCVARGLKAFAPLYQESSGRYGQVAFQGNPHTNDDLQAIIKEAESFRELGENLIIKVPSTVVGAQAMEEFTARGWSTIGTMSFSVDQYTYMAEAHQRGLARTDKKPRCLITMLPGMFSEYLAEEAERCRVEVSDQVRYYAGLTTAREAFKVFRERKYEAIIISGGARCTGHWTELVGGRIAITLSAALIEAVIKEPPPVVNRIQESAPAEAVAELREKFPDFVKACDVGALAPEQFHEYGPFIRFQNAILGGMGILMKEIQSRSKTRT